MSRCGRLEGRTCLIVGGTGGIGLASARRFLEEGARLVVSGLTLEETRSATAALADLGPLLGLVADVSDPDSVESLIGDSVACLGGRLDVVLHVAGISGRRWGDGPLHECSVEGWDKVMEVNARGVFLTNRAAVRQMLAQADVGPAGSSRGVVVNVGSVLAHAPSPLRFGTCAYAASKGAIRALTLAAAARYAADGIRFNLIEPGLIDTPMARRAVNDPQIRDYLVTKQPLAAGPGSADDVAEAALYLCEPAARFVTGAVLTVDGGWCLSEGTISDEDRT